VRDYPALRIVWPAPPTPTAIDLVLAVMDEAGPIGIDDVPGGIRAFFPDAAARSRAAALVAASSHELTCEPVDVPDEDWAARSQASLTAVQVGGVVVAPPWAAALAPRDAHLIIINPAMGFGTGHHASTRLCLGLIQQVDLRGDTRAIDVGTGSGVLALAAWRLGASDLVALDVDPDAVESARENVGLNDASGAIRVMESDLATAVGGTVPADLVTANLTGALLMRAAPELTRLTRPSGAIVVSGVLSTEADGVIAAFSAAGWTVATSADEDEWVGLLFRSATSPSASTAH
jgi:ribosomal protein L11 methyltransferase